MSISLIVFWVGTFAVAASLTLGGGRSDELTNLVLSAGALAFIGGGLHYVDQRKRLRGFLSNRYSLEQKIMEREAQLENPSDDVSG